MKFFLLLFLLMPSVLKAQFNTQKEKYWIYRERIKNFVVSDNCRGCGIPARSRESIDRLNYDDPPWMIGYWLGTLAMEYRLLSNAGADLTQTKKDIYYAIEAINRLDYYAEESWGCAKSLNGFLIRDDVSHIFKDQIVNGEPVEDLLNEGLVPPPDDFRARCMNSAYRSYFQPGGEASHDHLTGLFIGLTLLKAMIPPNESWNNTPFSYEVPTVTSFVKAVQNIAHRMITHLNSNNWIYKNPCLDRCVHGVHNAQYKNLCTSSQFFSPDDPCNCCSDGGSIAIPDAIGFAAANSYIQAGSSNQHFAMLLKAFLPKNAFFRIPWNNALDLSNNDNNALIHGDRLAPTLAALGNVWKYRKIGPLIISTSTKKIAKNLRDLVEDDKKFWEHLILMHRLLYGNQYDGSSNIITVSDAHYQCLLNAAPCRGWDGSGVNVEWGWTDRLAEDRCGAANPPCDGNSDARIDYMFYFNLFNNVVTQSSSAYSPVSINNLALNDIDKTNYIEYDKKNFHAAHNITSQNYEVTYLASEGQGRVNFAAGNKIILGNGFKVTNGGYFHGYIDPTIQAMACTEPGNTNCEGVFKKSADAIEEDTLASEDTLICSLDSIQVFYENDTTGGYSYHWDFGNGSASDSANPFIYYSSPGSYNITLILTDSLGNKDTITQAITISECPDDGVPISARFGNNSSAKNEKNKYADKSIPALPTEIKLIPNPSASGIFNVQILNFELNRTCISVLNVLGETVNKFEMGDGKWQSIIDISNQPKGIYIVKIQHGNTLNVRKIVYQ